MGSDFKRENIMKNKTNSEHSRKRDTFIVRKNLEKHQHIFEQYEEFSKELTARLRAVLTKQQEQELDQAAE